MKNWMRSLAEHYELMRYKYPADNLLILFDIDGTILDMRYKVFHLLKSCDQEHDTGYFERLQITDITFHEDDIGESLRLLRVPVAEIDRIAHWYNQNRWSVWALFEANRP